MYPLDLMVKLEKNSVAKIFFSLFLQNTIYVFTWTVLSHPDTIEKGYEKYCSYVSEIQGFPVFI